MGGSLGFGVCPSGVWGVGVRGLGVWRLGFLRFGALALVLCFEGFGLKFQGREKEEDRGSEVDSCLGCWTLMGADEGCDAKSDAREPPALPPKELSSDRTSPFQSLKTLRNPINPSQTSRWPSKIPYLNNRKPPKKQKDTPREAG